MNEEFFFFFCDLVNVLLLIYIYKRFFSTTFLRQKKKKNRKIISHDVYRICFLRRETFCQILNEKPAECVFYTGNILILFYDT